MTDPISARWSPKLRDALAAAGAAGDEARREGLEAIGEAFVLAFRGRVGGKIANDVTYEVSGGSVEVGSPSPLASVLERGRKPGKRPPAIALVKSMGVSHKVAEDRAKRIGQRGTKGRKYFEKTANEVNRNELPRIARETAERLGTLKSQ